jgi:hypothetical protein
MKHKSGSFIMGHPLYHLLGWQESSVVFFKIFIERSRMLWKFLYEGYIKGV